MAAVLDINAAPLRTVDELVRRRAHSFGDRPIVYYPSSGIQFVPYTMQQLDAFANRVARHYHASLLPRRSAAETPYVVAMLGPSNLEYLVTMLAMMKLGHTILFLSTRISTEAVTSLITATRARAVICDQRHVNTATEVGKTLSHIQVVNMVSRSQFEFTIEANSDTHIDVPMDLEVETSNIVYIIHSSGSTGFPKPIYQTHKAALANYSSSPEMNAFITLPLYHNHGICNLFRAIYSGKSIHMYNADLPLTSGHLTSIFQEHQFEIFYGVPYALKLMAETQLGISLLRNLKIVMYGGSACPDELGDLLVENNVNLVSHYGATEVGQLMTSMRPPGDNAWNYVREHDRISPFLKWIPRGLNLFECCVLDGWPAKLTSNQPDNSYATKDLFEPHPTIPKAWKYIARLDDTIVLVNGEKFNPVQMEGSIRSEPSVAEAVVFGVGRPYLGLMVVPAESTRGLSSEQIIDGIWPAVKRANQTAEAYARISKDVVKIMPHSVDYPRTDKGSVIRQAFYKAFAQDIDNIYEAEDAGSGGRQAMTVDKLKTYLKATVTRLLSKHGAEVDEHADFFALGMDSLQSIQLRSEILRDIDVGGQKIGQNVAFDYPSVNKLAEHLSALRLGSDADADQVPIESQMMTLVEKYTASFSPLTGLKKSSIVVTGSTGSLGAHIVALLAQNSAVGHIYCLVRAKNDEHALRRVWHSLEDRRLLDSISPEGHNKIRALAFDQSDKRLGLTKAIYNDIAASLRAVIHCAWSVNFSLNLSSFEHDCIVGVRNLLDLCLASGAAGDLPSFNFCSSVSTTVRAPADVIPEDLCDLSWAQDMGYAQSKAVAEHISMRAAVQVEGLKVRVLRIGQIIGDTKYGIWNATEAIPLQIQTALTTGALPRLPETPRWLPVDTVAQAVLDISLSSTGSTLANIVNKRTFRWTEDLLPALRKAGLSFQELSPREWVRRLRHSDPDPVANPPIKLLEFFTSKYDKEPHEMSHSKMYDTSKACALSPALDSAPTLDQDTVNKFVQYFLNNSWRKS